MQSAHLRGGEREIELHALCTPSEQDIVHDRLDDLLRLRRDGHGDPKALMDCAPLADQHLEDNLVDLVVAAVEQHRPDLLALLAEAIDPALPLLQTVRIRQVIVYHRVEVVLQVDALAETVGGDEHAALAPDQLGDLLPPLLVADFTGDGAHLRDRLDAPPVLATTRPTGSAQLG